MIVLNLEMPSAIAVAPSVWTARVWIARQRTSESGRVGIPRKLFIVLRNQGLDSILLPRFKARLLEVRRNRLDDLDATRDVEVDLFGGATGNIHVALDDGLLRATAP